MAKGKLQSIANRMKAFADENPRTDGDTIARYRVLLERGLLLTLFRDDENYFLSLGRKGVQPSEREIGICLAAFGVPDRARRSHLIELDEYCFYCFRWSLSPEVRQDTLFSLKGASKASDGAGFV